MRYRLQRHDGTDCSATMVPITVLRMVPIQRYRQIIMQAAILGNASGIILAHNHPSGNAKPSLQDDQITQKIREISQLIGITLLDHLIITDESYYSYADEGRI